ncbi:MAG: tetratricopeptide repeat protein [Bryobacterales bacterium]|nr:tetratricopeptide repeat protein [Bryobacterales bacterium]
MRPYEPLIEAAFRRKDWPELESLADRYLALFPPSPAVRYKAAVAAISQGKIDAAEKMATTMIARGEASERPRVHLILGLAQENKSDFAKAAESYRTFLRTAPNAPLASTARNKLAELEQRESVQP